VPGREGPCLATKRTPSARGGYILGVINVAPSPRVDQLDSAGQTILQLLNKAANVAEQNSKHAIDMAQQLSHQLRAAVFSEADAKLDYRFRLITEVVKDEKATPEPQ
jgi:hypothetical protein